MHNEFVEDLAGYLALPDNGEQKREAFDQLRTRYPCQRFDDGRVEFLPGEEGGRYLVQRPVRVESEPAETRLHRAVAAYLAEDDPVERLMMIDELQDEWDYSWGDDRSSITFRPYGGGGVAVGIPSLPVLAEAYNERTDEGAEAEERDRLSRVIKNSSQMIGTPSATIYEREGDVYVEEDVDEEGVDTRFREVDAVGDELPLQEALGLYRVVRDGPGEDCGKGVFDSIRGVFYTGHEPPFDVFHDPVSKVVGLFDVDSTDLWTGDEEELLEELDEPHRFRKHGQSVDWEEGPFEKFVERPG